MIRKYKQFINENNQKQLSNEQLLRNKINKIIDYTIIKQGVIKEKINEAIETSLQNNFYGICINPDFVDYVNYNIEDNNLKVISTLDFPNGDTKITDKLTDTIKIISDGANEIDMMIDINKYKKAYVEDDDTKLSIYEDIENDIKSIVNECQKNGVLLKVILETGILSLEELEDICRIVSNANVDFVQTSSGLNDIGSDLTKIKELRRLLPSHTQIKAAGGIRTLEQANKLYPYVDRIGTSVILK